MRDARYTFTVVLEHKSGRWEARVPALPAVRVHSAHRSELNRMAVKAVRDHVRSLLAEGRDIPHDEPAPAQYEKSNVMHVTYE